VSPVIGQVLSVRFVGGLPVSPFRGYRAWRPNWEVEHAGLIVDEDGSRLPAVYPASERVRAHVEIEIAGTGDTGDSGTMCGRLGGLVLEGPILLRDGRQAVPVAQADPPDSVIRRHTADVQWFLHGPSAPALLDNKTRLEVFLVLGRPPFFFARNVWVQALRLLVHTVGLDGIGSGNLHQAVELITNYCHRGHSLRYASGGHPSTLGVSYDGGTFALSSFLAHVDREVSCFGTSAAVLVLSCAVGIDVRWLRISFMGYIVETSLVGVGRCNNPFFILHMTNPIVCQKDPVRFPFQFHSFNEMSGTIFDACVGPHLGMSLRQTYLDSAVDPINHDNLGVSSEHSIEDYTDRLAGLC
jgi:hypothetical protein